ncbi:hypothetical protein BCR37DRAFT_415361 [Protomyces lactucae-debilis]|uniref:RNA polymerase II elongation factor ELL N-terminal domain-containing protein n=1 Tax=Protomyces lactucae-debilis TaxID=2754530 RepID=A0A1Y2F0Y6_PROLT|nr:uncharacterized protein BCR37DRAFT_415361 [Protomyces lactucae-debilis]ORY77006.1 hypothetical protein BCR37DRAFT_415361 [Protomyces lactucae-debilis]
MLGQERFPFSIAPESAALEVYKCPRTTQEHLDLVGRVSHKVTVRRELADTITDKLKSRNAEAKAAKEGRSVQQLEVDPLSRNKQNARLPRSITPVGVAKGRQSPFLQARKSPLLVASSPKPNAVPLKTKLIQILAIGASSADELCGKLRTTFEVLQPLLTEVARQVDSEWVLRDSFYAQVKVWDWRHCTTAERTQVVSRATQAFDSLKLPASATARLKLVHPEKRNAMSDLEMSDTSPLALNPPINAASVTSGTILSGTEHDKKKPTTANGILSAGKLAKKRKLDVASASSRITPEVTVSDIDLPSDRRTKRSEDASSKVEVSSKTAQSSKASNVANTDKTREKGSALRNRSTSRSRLQTFERKAPSVTSSSGDSLEDALAASNRTSSITSTSTDRSVLSISTAKTSVSGRSPAEKKKPDKALSTSVASVPKKASIFDSKRTDANKARQTSGASSSAPFATATTTTVSKRKASELQDDKADESVKRAKMATDLFELARQYKSQYPEYQALHAQVYVQKVADEALKAKFVKMHNDMKTWKQLLWAQSDGQRNAMANH